MLMFRKLKFSPNEKISAVVDQCHGPAFTQSGPDRYVLLPIYTADHKMLIVVSRQSHRDLQRKATRAGGSLRFRILAVLLQIKRVVDPDVRMQTLSILGQTGRVEVTKEFLNLLNRHKSVRRSDPRLLTLARSSQIISVYFHLSTKPTLAIH